MNGSEGSRARRVLARLAGVAHRPAPAGAAWGRRTLLALPDGQVWCSDYYAGGQRLAVRVEGDPAPANHGLFFLQTIA